MQILACLVDLQISEADLEEELAGVINWGSDIQKLNTSLEIRS